WSFVRYVVRYTGVPSSRSYALSLHDALPICAEAIADFCAQPPADIVLLITGGEWSNKHGGKWSAAVASAGCLVVAKQVRPDQMRSEEHTSELQSRENLVCRLRLEKKKQ